MPKRDDRPVDADVKVPAAVRAAAAAADQLHQEIYNPTQDAQAAQQQANGANGPNGAGDDGVNNGSNGVDGTHEVQGQPDAQDQEQPVEQTQQQQPDDSWEHRYKSLRGRFENQEHRHVSELRSLREHVQNLEGTLAAVSNAQQNAQRGQPVNPDLDPQSLGRGSLAQPGRITEQEAQEYGPEFLGVVAKKAYETLTPEVAALQQKIAQLEGQLGQIGGHVAADARGRMENYLDSQLPSWREINYNQEFLNWLSLRDVYSGGIRHELLKSAFARNDAPRVLAFFQGFISDEAATAPRQERQEPSPSRNSKLPLASFAAPGRAQSAGSQPAEKPVISTAQIAQFYADSASGKYRGREEERARLETQIFAAQRDGRIVQ